MSLYQKTPAELDALRAKARLRLALHREVEAMLSEPLSVYRDADQLFAAADRLTEEAKGATPTAEAFPVLTAFLQAQDAQQMTLGGMIAALERMPLAAPCDLHHPHSYRGYYEDVAFEMRGTQRTVGEVLAEAKKALGATLTGYKGGGYRMDADTLVWVADYGNCGHRLIALSLLGRGVMVGTASDGDA